MSIKNNTRSKQHEIAIIGMSCRFPGGADDPELFWNLLKKGQHAVVDVPKNRWNYKKFYDKDPKKPGKMYVKKAAFLQQPIDEFDNQFFGVSPREAANYDPQQRLMLEISYEAMENAGLNVEKLAGSDTGVFFGGFMMDNTMTQTSSHSYNNIGPHTATSSTLTILANRVSYAFDFKGPSFSLDTACSSSLVAIHQACQSIINEESSIALAGGVNIMHRPEPFLIMCKGKMLAEDGCSKSFDERADGYGRGEGAGLVVLKSLVQAIKDNDPILSVIMASGVNQDGRTQGITVPNPKSQQALINQVCDRANIDATNIHYVEAHGTGTAVGDPLEANAIGETIGVNRQQSPCLLGSLKSTVGHMEAAAGIASIIKSTLCLNHQQVPPQANLVTPNPKIPFFELGLKLPRKTELLPSTDGNSYVGINSFGYGGTNAFAILRNLSTNEQATIAKQKSKKQPTPTTACPSIMLLSARDPQALKNHASNIFTLMTSSNAPKLTDLLYSLAHHREHHNYRVTLSGFNEAELEQKLNLLLEPESVVFNNIVPVDKKRKPKTVFVCSGMGPQWWKMGQELYQTEQLYRDWLSQCDDIFTTISGWSIKEEMLKSEQDSKISQTNIAQSANFILQVGIALIYQARGIEADAFIGHSVGEVSSAYLAGALNLKDALLVSYHRSRIQYKAAGIGGMLAVGLSQEDIQTYLKPFKNLVSIAAINGLSAVTLAGHSESLLSIAEQLTIKGIFNRVLQVEVAYHSPTMEPLYDEIIECLQPLNPTIPSKPLYSTVDGQLVTNIAYDNQYWYKNVRQPVVFMPAVNQLIDDGYTIFVEVGPHPVLSQNIKECLHAKDCSGVTLHSLNRKIGEQDALINAIGQYYDAGGEINLKRLLPQGQRTALPSYPWQRTVLWHENETSKHHRLAPQIHPLLQQKVSSPDTLFETRINANYQDYIYDHQINNIVVMPGAGYIEMALALIKTHLNSELCTIEEFSLSNAFIINDDDEPTMRIAYDQTNQHFNIHSCSDKSPQKWTLHAQGRISLSATTPNQVTSRLSIEKRCRTHITSTDFYQMLSERGQHYGPHFQRVNDLHYNENEVLATIVIGNYADIEQYTLHPTILDSAFQTFLAVLNDNVYMPVELSRINVIAKPQGAVWVHAVVVVRERDHAVGDLQIYDLEGNLLVDIQGLTCKALNKQDTEQYLSDISYSMIWHELEQELEKNEQKPQHWLALTDGNIFSHQLCQAIEKQGGMVTQEYNPINVGKHNNLISLVKYAIDQGCEHILYLWGLYDNEDPIGYEKAVNLLNFIKALDHCSANMKLTVLTQGALMVHSNQADLSLSQAASIGVARVAANEYDNLFLRVIDLDSKQLDYQQVINVLNDDSGNGEIALRDAKAYICRFQNNPMADKQFQRKKAHQKDLVQLEVKADIHKTNIDFRKIRVGTVNADQIKVEISALTLHLGSENKTWFQGSGQVIEIGKNVTDVALGDSLCGYFNAQPANCVITNNSQYLTVKKPTHISHQSMLMSLSTYTKCFYALNKLDTSKKIRKVLIQQADSHFGTAAINISKYLGYEVFVTVDDLKIADDLLANGVKQVFDAKSQDFIERIQKVITQDVKNQGIDIILNTFNNELRIKSFSLLAPQGHFIEVNPVSDTGAFLPMSVFNKNISVAVLDDQALLNAQSYEFKNTHIIVTNLINKGDLPILEQPHYELCELVAFTDKGFDRQISTNIIVTMEQQKAPWLLPAKLQHPIKSKACYLVTGGLGGFGLASAEALVRHGAKYLILVSRSGAKSMEAQKGIASLQEKGCKITVISADISCESSVIEMMKQVINMQNNNDFPPLCGVIHSAAVLDDDYISQLTEQRMKAVMLPKAKGAWLLHQHTLSHPIEFFVLYSSVSSIIGNAKQANYVAANTFLDHLAHYRQQLGLPATAVNWGAIGDVGMAARNSKTEDFLKHMGIFSLAPTIALDSLFEVIKQQPSQLGLIDIDWNKWALNQSTSRISLRFKNLIETSNQQNSSDNSRISELLKMDSEQAQLQSILEQFISIISQTLNMPIDCIHTKLSLINLGVDSLLCMEFQSKIKAQIGINLSILTLLNSESITIIAQHILALVKAQGIEKNEQKKGVKAIPRTNNCAELSFAQQRLWFIDQLQGGSTEYNMFSALEVIGNFDLQIAENAICNIIERHEVLRTVYRTQSNHPIESPHEIVNNTYQLIQPEFEFSIKQHDLTHLDHQPQNLTIQAMIAAERLKNFDLTQDLMIRASYLNLSHSGDTKKRGVVLFNMHHIASDSWSVGLYFKEFVAHYQALAQGKSEALPSLSVQYADYAQWQSQYLVGDILEKQLGYWSKQLADIPVCHSLPLDYPRPVMKAHKGSIFNSRLPLPLTKELKKVAKDNDVTLFMLLHGAFSLVISRHSNQNDIVIGTPMANRMQPNLESLIGFFANTQVLRVNTNHDNLTDFFAHVRTVNLEAQAHQDIPFEQLVEHCKVPRSTQHAPLFQILFTMDSLEQENLNLPGIDFVAIEDNEVGSKFDIELSYKIDEEGLLFSWIFDLSLFTQAHIETLSQHLNRLLNGIAKTPISRLVDLPILCSEEQEILLNSLNDTHTNYDQNILIHELFEKQVKQNPNNTALIFSTADDEQTLSYQQLNQASNRLAHYLCDQGVNNQSLIGVCVDRSPQMVIALLAILKAGGAYVPLDPSHPVNRLDYIINDTQLTYFISQTEYILNLDLADNVNAINLDEMKETLSNCPQTNLTVKQSGKDLAYVIYTSGSTGQPKGVMIEQKTVTNLLLAMNDKCNNAFSSSSKLLSVTTIAFDIAGLELFGSLVHGGEIVLASAQDAIDPFRLNELIEQKQINLIQATPATWSLLVNAHWAGKENLVALSGGEALSVELAEQLLPRVKQLYNCYGPTEATIWSLVQQVQHHDLGNDHLLLGGGLNNYHHYVLNKQHQLVPDGCIGELCIGGDTLARGYFNNEALTKERFITNPLPTDDKKLYKTGDLVRFINTERGAKLAFIGRIDSQVKIRGFRIELGEIESKIMSCLQVDNVLVMAKIREGDSKHLVAYLASKNSEHSQLLTEIKQILEQSLPSYMIPSSFVILEGFPLNTNGKIDRHALPDADGNLLQEEYLSPETVLQQGLVNIWAKLLCLDPESISIEGNFFQLGGHSLLAVSLINEVRQQFSVEVEIKEIFNRPTIKSLAILIDSLKVQTFINEQQENFTIKSEGSL